MITLLAIDAAQQVVPHIVAVLPGHEQASQCHPFLPCWLAGPKIGTPGFKSFPIMMAAALALLAWTIFLYDPGSASSDSNSEPHDDRPKWNGG